MESNAAALQQVIAAWVQAIGSIIAIGIAIWVPMRQARNVQRERKQDKADALRAIGTVMEIASRLVRTMFVKSADARQTTGFFATR